MRVADTPDLIDGAVDGACGHVRDGLGAALRVAPVRLSAAKALKAENGKLISEMEELTGKTVLVKSDPLLHQEKFDLA